MPKLPKARLITHGRSFGCIVAGLRESTLPAAKRHSWKNVSRVNQWAARTSFEVRVDGDMVRVFPVVETAEPARGLQHRPSVRRRNDKDRFKWMSRQFLLPPQLAVNGERLPQPWRALSTVMQTAFEVREGLSLLALVPRRMSSGGRLRPL